MKQLTKENFKKFEERFNELMPDYRLQFGEDPIGMGCAVDSFTVDDNGRTTLKATESYLNNQYAIRYREYVRHPKFTTRQVQYLLGEVDTLKDKYYVMYWNDREDYPVAVFEVMAKNECEAEDIVYKNGGDAYEDDWPLLTETDEWMSKERKKRYKDSIYTDYYDLTKGRK